MKRHFGKTIWSLLIVLVMIGVGLAVACGGDDTPPPTDTSVPPTDVPTANRDPEAEFVWHPDVVPAGDNYRTPYSFMAMASDPDGDELTYEWAFTGARPPTATGEAVTTYFPGIADYEVTLTVTDGRGGEAVVTHTVPLLRGGELPTPLPIPPTPDPNVLTKYTWEFLEVGAGAKPALALNSEGIPGIAYIEEEIHGVVRYGQWWPTDEWNPEFFGSSIVAEGYFYAPLDLAYGPDDAPYITWHDHQDPDNFVPELGDAAYGFYKDFEWEVGYAYSRGHDGWDNSIAVDSQGNVHMIAIDPYNFNSLEGVEYYFNDGEEWTVESIGSPPVPYEWGTGLVLDAQDSPHVTFHEPLEGDLFYATKGDDGWTIHTVESEGDVGKYASLALDRNDMPVISYMELTGPEKGISSGIIKVAKATEVTDSGPVWEIDEIGQVDDLFMGFRGARLITSVVIDSANKPIVAYSDQSTIYVAYQEGSTWQNEVVRYRAELPFGQLVSLAIGADDTLHLAFTEVSRREFPGVFGTVMYGRGTPQEF